MGDRDGGSLRQWVCDRHCFGFQRLLRNDQVDNSPHQRQFDVERVAEQCYLQSSTKADNSGEAQPGPEIATRAHVRKLNFVPSAATTKSAFNAMLSPLPQPLRAARRSPAPAKRQEL